MIKFMRGRERREGRRNRGARGEVGQCRVTEPSVTAGIVLRPFKAGPASLASHGVPVGVLVPQGTKCCPSLYIGCSDMFYFP